MQGWRSAIDVGLILGLCALASHAAPPLNVRDSTEYRNDIYTGQFARLYRGDTLLDSLETGFGLKPVGTDAAVYLKVRAYNERGLKGTYFSTLMLAGRDSVSVLRLPLYNEHFSSPNVIDSLVYYWAFHEDRVLAARYRVRTGTLDTMTLRFEGTMITDSPFYFKKPVLGNRGVIFQIQDGRGYTLSRDITVAKKLTSEGIAADEN